MTTHTAPEATMNTCDNAEVEHPGFPCDHPAPAPGTEVPGWEREHPITDVEREAALQSWPAALVDDPFAKLPAGMERLVQITWTAHGVIHGTEFTHRLFVSSEADARRQIRRDFLSPGVPSSWIQFVEVTGL